MKSMALNIKNLETEQLATEVAAMTGETKTEAIRRALEERKQRLSLRVVQEDRVTRFRRFLEQEVWPNLPSEVKGKPLSKRDKEAILGYGPEGV
jgi:antitoxin VapB